MFPALRINDDFLTGHLIVVLVVGMAFFLVQVGLTMRVCRRGRRHERLLTRLLHEFEQGGSGRDGGQVLHQTWSWIQWVVANFPAGARVPPGNYSREDVLQELDTRIASSSDYLLLQRMGIMAPLLGVVLTVAGFYWLHVEQFEEQSLRGILLAVTPLISGVGAGALLALINQALLHVAGRRLETLRMAARMWFDAVIWSHVGRDAQAATADAVHAMKQLAGSMNGAANQYTAGARQLSAATVSTQDAALQLREVVQSFSAEMKGVPEALQEMQRTTAAAAGALEELIHVGSRSVSNLDVSVAAFRTALDREFAPAADLQYRSSKILAESAQQVGGAIALLKSGSDELARTVQANTASYQMMDESVRQHVVPGNRRFYDAAQGLTGQMADLTQLVRALSSSVQTSASEFDSVAGGLVRSLSSFRDAIDDRLSPAVARHTRQVESVDRSIEQLQQLAEGMSEGATALNAALRDGSQFVSQTTATCDVLASSVKELADAGSRLRQTIESDVAPSQQTMRDAATSFAQSAQRLSDLIQQDVGPAASRLAELDHTFRSLKEAVSLIKNLGHVRADIDRLNIALSRAADIGEAISSLPARIRDIPEQDLEGAHAADAADSRSQLSFSLSGKPR